MAPKSSFYCILVGKLLYSFAISEAEVDYYSIFCFLEISYFNLNLIPDALVEDSDSGLVLQRS